jgi:hypothetical protein
LLIFILVAVAAVAIWRIEQPRGAYYGGVFFPQSELNAKVKSGDEHTLQEEKELMQKQHPLPDPAH